jgi:hypothetical protein
MRDTADISSDGIYRYTLTRDLHTECDLFESRARAGAVAFCMLNPSTADAERDDPTIRRCIGFGRAWGFGQLLIVNCYAYRATDPTDLRRAAKIGVDIVGPENDSAIGRAAAQAQVVIAAWGNHADLERARRVATLIGASKLRCLGISKTGAPWHPLYLRGDLEPMLWRGP